MTDFQIIIASDAESFAKMIREKLDKGYKMVNSNMTIRPYVPVYGLENLSRLGSGPAKDRSIREFYAYMEKEI